VKVSLPNREGGNSFLFPYSVPLSFSSLSAAEGKGVRRFSLLTVHAQNGVSGFKKASLSFKREKLGHFPIFFGPSALLGFLVL